MARRVLVASIAVLTGGFLAIPLGFAPGENGAAAPTPTAIADIPKPVLAAYLQWGSLCPGLRWELLAAVGKVESGHGTHGGATVGPDGEVRPYILGPPLDGTGAGGNTTPLPVGAWAGQWGLTGAWQQALGPMQFLPGTFQAWALDGNRDGHLDPHNIGDAVAAAANYLCGTDHAVTDERAAVRRYNNSDTYIDGVLQWAATYAAAGTAPLAIGAAPSPADVAANPNLDIYPGGRDDIAAGRVDNRILQILVAVATQHRLTITALISGHSRCVDNQPDTPGCAVSNHYHGRAVDIAAIDGVAVSARNAAAVDLMHQLAALAPPLRPDEIGGPVDTGEPGVFTDTFHTNHIHVGFRP